MVAARFFRSAPAQKVLPWPDSTTARTSGVSEMRSSTQDSSFIISVLSALTGGLASRIVATPPSIVTSSAV